MILLQVALKVTLVVEHRIAAFFSERSGSGAMALRLLAIWGVLFGSNDPTRVAMLPQMSPARRAIDHDRGP